jgi:hypothetical protein
MMIPHAVVRCLDVPKMYLTPSFHAVHVVPETPVY